MSEWKNRYEEAIARIEKLEQMRGSSGSGTTGTTSSTVDCSASAADLNVLPESNAVSPCSSPRQSPPLLYASSLPCEMVSFQGQSPSGGMVETMACEGMHEREEHDVKHLSENLSRPA